MVLESRIGRFVAVSLVVIGLPLAGDRIIQGGLIGAVEAASELEEEVEIELAEVALPPEPRDPSEFEVEFDPEVFGLSGALRTIQSLPGAILTIPFTWSPEPPPESWYRWIPSSGPRGSIKASLDLEGRSNLTAPEEPGTYHLEVGIGDERSWILDDLTLIVLVPFEEKEGTHLRGYHIGRYPTEGEGRTDRYAPPAGFIEVTPENHGLRLSKHLSIREFITKDQHNVWPKFVVIDPLLLEKIELMMQELNEMGVRADRVHIMSGYRTPQYNARGIGRGRATLSRHQYGDAADLWIDNEARGYISDLNGDGKRDTGDVRVMLRAIERVEEKYPELIGGAGIYAANSVRGPFLHIDVRGKRARW